MEEAWAVQRSKKAVRGRSDAVQLTRMDYAMKSLSLLYPSSLARHVAVSTSVVTQQLVPKAGADAPRARPCRVSTADRSVRKGITACSLEDLLHKVRTPSNSSPWGYTGIQQAWGSGPKCWGAFLPYVSASRLVAPA
ncbi:PREDICTED: cell death activator CIDE-3-like [Chinchilla lanigera]|uniref:cell death activator CIDE-3-like n=1 Tax=Chinchilla lanigera TaxID=34839 RepID=UPI000695A6CE|nr:PREDICTED: cell death activator CIDE-3-like [Chinchilla lanigera]